MESLLFAARAFGAVMLTDACTIERRGTPVTNDLDGTVTVPMTPIYSGVCRVQQAAAPWAGPATVGQAEIGLSALEIQLPVEGTEDVTRGDVVTVTACGFDASLVGRSFSVQGAHHATHKTTRRLPLQEILG